MLSRRAGDFDAAEVEYAAVGAGSYHWEVVDTSGDRRFVTVDDLDQKAWLGATRDATFDGLRRAFDTAVALHDGGLPFVVAPIPSRLGDSVRRLDSRYAIALFPFVEGEAGQFGWIVDDDERRSVVEMVAELHQRNSCGRSGRTPGRPRSARPPSSRGSTPGARRAVVGWAALRAGAARGQGRRVRAGRVAHAGRPARRRGGATRRRLGRDPRRASRRQRHANRRGPRPGRLGHGCARSAGARPLDARGRRGRCGRPLRPATGTQLDDVALDFFRLAWDLADLAEYLNVLRSPHQEDDDSVWGLRGPQGQRRDTEKLGGAARISTVAATLYRIQTNNLTISRLG